MKAPLPPAQPVVELAPPAAGKLFRPAGIPLRRWAALLLAALVMRIVAVIGEPVIPRDGVHFLGMARIAAEEGWGPLLEREQHPLYPALVSLVHGLASDWETAGLLVSILASTLTVIPVVLLGNRVAGSPAGLLGGWVFAAARYPLQYGPSPIADGLHALLFACAAGAGAAGLGIGGARAAGDGSHRPGRAGSFFVAGLFAGLAYLTRPEGLVIAAALAAAAVVRLATGRKSRADLLGWGRGLILLFLGLCLTAGPYAAWLSYRSGAFTLTRKKDILSTVISHRDDRAADPAPPPPSRAPEPEEGGRGKLPEGADPAPTGAMSEQRTGTATPPAARTTDPHAATPAAPTAASTSDPTADTPPAPAATPPAAQTTDPHAAPPAAAPAAPTAAPTANSTAAQATDPGAAPTAAPTANSAAAAPASPTGPPAVPTATPPAATPAAPPAAPPSAPSVAPGAAPSVAPTSDPTPAPTASPPAASVAADTAARSAAPAVAPTRWRRLAGVGRSLREAAEALGWIPAGFLVLGLASRLRARSCLLAELYLFLPLAMFAILLSGIYVAEGYTGRRHAYPLVPLLEGWVGLGLVQVGGALAARLPAGSRWRARGPGLLTALLVAAMLPKGLGLVSGTDEKPDRWIREAGLALRAHLPSSDTVLAVNQTGRVAFYSGARVRSLYSAQAPDPEQVCRSATAGGERWVLLELEAVPAEPPAGWTLSHRLPGGEGELVLYRRGD